jgi:uncharacterized membrane protein YidH (DUF202 family)
VALGSEGAPITLDGLTLDRGGDDNRGPLRPAGEPRRAGRPTAVVAVAVTLGLAAVAVAASGAGGAGSSDNRMRLPSLDTATVVLGAVAFVVGIATLLASVTTARRQRDFRRRPVWFEAAALAVIALVALVYSLFSSEPDPSDEAPAAESGAEVVEEDTGASDEPTDRRDLLLVALVLAGGTALVVLAARQLRPAEAESDKAEVAGAVGEVLDDLIEQLRHDPDPRHAVITAYGRMEQTFAHHGRARRPAEAPLEFLAGALAWLDAGAPEARRLTSLFEAAMFSDHAFDRAMQDDAIDALIAVRDDLRRGAVTAASEPV